MAIRPILETSLAEGHRHPRGGFARGDIRNMACLCRRLWFRLGLDSKVEGPRSERGFCEGRQKLSTTGQSHVRNRSRELPALRYFDQHLEGEPVATGPVRPCLECHRESFSSTGR